MKAWLKKTSTGEADYVILRVPHEEFKRYAKLEGGLFVEVEITEITPSSPKERWFTTVVFPTPEHFVRTHASPNMLGSIYRG